MALKNRTRLLACVIVLLLALCVVAIMLNLPGTREPTDLTQLRQQLGQRIYIGMPLQQARVAAEDLGFKMETDVDRTESLRGTIRERGGFWIPERIIMLRLYVSDAETVEKVQCTEAFTGP